MMTPVRMEQLLACERTLGVGEIGLDFGPYVRFVRKLRYVLSGATPYGA